MSLAGRQQWRAPAQHAGTSIEPRVGVAFSPVSWWFVSWRARVHEESTGNVEARLLAIADAMEHSDMIDGLPAVHHVRPASVSFEFWFEAATAREAAGGARVALRRACRAAGVGDPTLESSRQRVDVILMFEEVPTLHQGES